MEKEAILKSYKLFLKTCNFDIQILIQSNKKDINNIINNILINKKDESEKIKDIKNNYCKYIKNLNQENISSSKNFFILIKKISPKTALNNVEEEINSEYIKIQECLARCGNKVLEVSSIEEIIEIFKSFFIAQDYIKHK